MPRYKVKKSFCLGGGVDLEIGQEIRVPGPGMTLLRARQKARDGWLEEIAPEPAPETEVDDGETEGDEAETEELEAEKHPTGGEPTTNAPPPPGKPRGRGRPRGSGRK